MKKVYRYLLNNHNEENKQLVMVIEELSELQKELTKHLRGKLRRECLAEETAHVLFSIEKIIVGFRMVNEVKQEYNKCFERVKEIYGNEVK